MIAWGTLESGMCLTPTATGVVLQVKRAGTPHISVELSPKEAQRLAALLSLYHW